MRQGMVRTMEKRLLSVRDVCESLGLGHTKLYQLLSAGELRAIKIGRATRFLPEEIDRYVRTLAEQAEAAVR